MIIQSVSDNYYNQVENSTNKTIESLATGKSINTAEDNPSALVQINRVSAMVASKLKEVDNQSLAVSMNQVQDAGLGQISDNLQQMRELMTQANNGPTTQESKNAIQKQLDSLTQSTQTIVSNTSFGSIKLIDPQEKLQTALKGINVNDDPKKIDDAIKEVSQQRADTSARIEQNNTLINNALTEINNQNEGLSNLQDTDMAQAAMKLVGEQIKMQGSTMSVKNIMQLNTHKIDQLLNAG